MDRRFDDVILRTEDGQEVKVPLNQLSAEDLDFISLTNPPEMSVDFLKSFNQHIPKPSPLWGNPSPVVVFRCSFGARVKQKNFEDYNHELTIEIFPIGRQRYDPDNYHLLARIKSPPFKLTRENGRRYEFEDKTKIEIVEFMLEGARYIRGEEFAEGLVLVRDERGEVVAYNSTKKWLYNNLDKFLALPVGAWFDDKCTRVHPTSPKDVLRTWGDNNR